MPPQSFYLDQFFCYSRIGPVLHSGIQFNLNVSKLALCVHMDCILHCQFVKLMDGKFASFNLLFTAVVLHLIY